MKLEVQQLLDGIPFPAVGLRKDLQIAALNQPARELFGGAAAAGRRPEDLLPGIDLAALPPEGVEYRLDSRRLRIWMISPAVDCRLLILQPQHEDSPAISVSADEAQLDKIEYIISAVSDGVVYFRAADHRVVWANRSAATMLDTTRAELRGRDSNQLWHGLCLPDTAACPVERCFAAQTPYWVECSTTQGTELVAHAYPVHDEAAEFIGVVLTLRDITYRKTIEEQLQEAFDRADSANLVKDQFIANISHELRTPLNGIIGITELMLRSSLTPDQERFIGMIQQSGNRLHEVVREILAFTQLETEELRGQEIRFHLGALMRDTAEPFQARALRKGLGFRITIPAELQTWVEGQSGRLRQILRSLLDNAVKFTREGSIEVRLTQTTGEQPADGGISCEICVADTGIGIPPEYLQQIFEPFMQVEAGFRREYGGIGLGLSMAQRQARAMNTELQLASTPGRGTRVFFTMQLRRVNTATGLVDTGDVSMEYVSSARGSSPGGSSTPSPGGSAAVSGSRILVAEDDRINQRVITAILRAQGCVVETVENGRQALSVLETGDYDLVLMDLQMPEMDGLQATQIIRDPASPVRDHSIPIVAVTAFASELDRTACMDAGMDGFLGKPISAAKLLQTIREYASSGDLQKE
ncbi:response regulator [Spirochaeta africana]|uniref:histidine kinase n=1 Tax=Spirochaeta africana (strain ATCC 700263 / DSM 8902 / Z-7692) TaxID=889378 RepID=H9UFU5_SPIAZ|nr:response regulator [Spirochaeta africana]AFG36388.1 signal transduction histidine kinase [Spirochaeta africana DSM 8902]